MRALLLLIGIALTAGTVLAMVKSMLMPRASRSLVADAIHRGIGAVVRAPIGLLRSYGGQDRWLALAPPIAILLELATYVAVLIASLGLVVYGTTDLTFGQALYQSGSTLTTLGIVEPVNVASAITVYIAAFLELPVRVAVGIAIRARHHVERERADGEQLHVGGVGVGSGSIR